MSPFFGKSNVFLDSVYKILHGQMHNPNFRTINIILLLIALGTIGVGIFTEDFSYIHGAIASAAFFLLVS